MSSSTDSILNADRINYLNIGLMLLSCAVAFLIPFELFLFVYAVLGPLHYLTEISWLHERKYFSKGKYDFIFLGLAAVALFLTSYVLGKPEVMEKFEMKPIPGELVGGLSTAFVYVAFIAALAMILLKSAFYRFIAVLVILVSALITRDGIIFFSVFLPTLVHVYIFTGLFMLYGALKGRSRSGYLACVIFILIPLTFVFIHPNPMELTGWAKESYPQFAALNMYMLNLWDENIYTIPITSYEAQETMRFGIYASDIGITFMRFIAFAYTYHYLNWFSKTTVIKWHKVSKVRLAVILALWIGAVWLYKVNYKLGFDVLFLLSFLHVFLEFPLNHVTWIGIVTETKSIISGKPPSTPGIRTGVQATAPVVKGKKK